VILWIVRAWWVWVTIGIVVVAYQSYVFSVPLEDCVRFTALAFQVLGIIVVAKGLRNLVSFPVEWLRQFPLPSFTPQAYELHLEPGSLPLSGGVVDLRVIRAPTQDLSIEQRLAQLEGRLAEQENLTHQIQTSIVEVRRLQREALESERRSRESAYQTLQTKLEELTTGSLHLELIGFIWILLGTVLGAAPAEIILLPVKTRAPGTEYTGADTEGGQP
jgi:hypothetical protein